MIYVNYHYLQALVNTARAVFSRPIVYNCAVMKPTLLLLTGIPGVGKTTLGQELAIKHSFKHYDREQFKSWTLIEQVLFKYSLPLFTMLATVRFRRIVISWGFSVQNDQSAIQKLIDLGYSMVWIDGDRQVAYQNYLIRDQKSGQDIILSRQRHQRQLSQINQLDLNIFRHQKLNPFKSDGSFYTPASLIKKVIAN